MPTTPGKRTAKLRTTLTKRVVDALQPTDKSWIAWDDKLTGFGVCIRPSGTKSFIVNYRTGDRSRKAPNKRVVIGKYGKTTPDQARRLARGLGQCFRFVGAVRQTLRQIAERDDNLVGSGALQLRGVGESHGWPLHRAQIIRRNSSHR